MSEKDSFSFSGGKDKGKWPKSGSFERSFLRQALVLLFSIVVKLVLLSFSFSKRKG